MRLALVFPGFQSSPTDWCIPVFTNLVRILAATPGVEVTVFTLRYPHRADKYRIGNAEIISFGGGPILGRHIRLASIALLWQQFLTTIRREHSKKPFALVHGFWATESGYLATRAARNLNIPSLVHLAGGELTHLPSIHYGNRREPIAGTLVRRSLRLATAITVPSVPFWQQLAARHHAALRKAHRWSPGVDTTMFAPATPTPSTTLRVAHVASLLPVKDQETLLRGLAIARTRAPQTPITLSIAGTGPLRPHLENLAAELDLTDHVRFLGELPHEKLPAFYQQHDLFALSSLHEAQCLAALEAMSCALPLISTPVGIAPQAAQSGAAILYPRRDPTALATAFLHAARHPLDTKKRGHAARHLVKEHFELQQSTANLLALYATLTPPWTT